jgi:hypothetical protein
VVIALCWVRVCVKEVYAHDAAGCRVLVAHAFKCSQSWKQFGKVVACCSWRLIKHPLQLAFGFTPLAWQCLLQCVCNRGQYKHTQDCSRIMPVTTALDQHTGLLQLT